MKSIPDNAPIQIIPVRQNQTTTRARILEQVVKSALESDGPSASRFTSSQPSSTEKENQPQNYYHAYIYARWKNRLPRRRNPRLLTRSLFSRVQHIERRTACCTTSTAATALRVYVACLPPLIAVWRVSLPHPPALFCLLTRARPLVYRHARKIFASRATLTCRCNWIIGSEKNIRDAWSDVRQRCSFYLRMDVREYCRI